MTVGCFIIGALGEVATTIVAGHRALTAGMAGTTGLVTERPWFAGAGLVPFEDIRFGGIDVREGTLETAVARQAHSGGSIPRGLFDSLGGGGHLEDLPAVSRWDPALPAPERVRLAVSHLNDFRESVDGHVVVLHLASTEAPLDGAPDWSGPVPDSLIWARAAAETGCAHVNFTPSPGFDVEPVRDEFGSRIPWAGNDGKTGETLLKTVLAPMFVQRNLKVLSWEGLNLLGNGDGEVLRDPQRARGKLDNKDNVLGRILDYDLHSRTRIDYTPSLGDWKTAWDLIHFEGFLGVPMTLQFTWQGCDSALAAPLCLDLVRLAAKALDGGRTGGLEHCAAFFKNPVGAEVQGFPEQMALLTDWAAGR